MPEWYEQVCLKAELAEFSPVKGCMVIRPNGYAIWEAVQAYFNANIIKPMGVKNAYFPLFIPESFFHKEAEHAEGFSPEVAWLDKEITGEGERLAVRPTSETIMYATFKNWIHSYRDLPLLINQWANVVRWEMRTRLFLRTTEFLWQEGHTVHSTGEEADAFARTMLDEYVSFAQDWLAIPVVPGQKSESEKFAGAQTTYCVEAMMQDGKALQFGTSHFLGQNFAKAFDVKFTDDKNELQFGWQTSWGVSTRMIGGLIMTHADDQGLVLPPRIAPIQVVIVPLWFKDGQKEVVLPEAEELARKLRDAGIRVKVDARDLRPGEKFFHWEKKGVPVRVELGPKDLEAGTAVVVRRDENEKRVTKLDELADSARDLLDEIQSSLFNRAKAFRDRNTVQADTWDEFKAAIEDGKFVLAHWDGTAETEAAIKEETAATIRCIPFDRVAETGACVRSGKPSEGRVLFARSY